MMAHRNRSSSFNWQPPVMCGSSSGQHLRCQTSLAQRRCSAQQTAPPVTLQLDGSQQHIGRSSTGNFRPLCPGTPSSSQSLNHRQRSESIAADIADALQITRILSPATLDNAVIPDVHTSDGGGPTTGPPNRNRRLSVQLQQCCLGVGTCGSGGAKRKRNSYVVDSDCRTIVENAMTSGTAYSNSELTADGMKRRKSL